ncbi:isochorismatase family protein [Roseomonas populi]|uniref:Isochorismatase family protein n=1 Tax=Roseomonas populi TaxID=3121582 RepID=A0ABT1X1B8_9PROT|nr:isochorismatase family protein [Roseomonas pecuniae]MCR0981900.1 isochorismatase family protein [Roseomonas pecuniae]
MASEPVWTRFLTERDKAVFAAAGYGVTAGFGKRPVLLVVDVSWAFCGDRPEPILEAIKRWPNACGAEAWDAIAVIGRLASAFRAQSLPVIYTTGESRADGWDLGSWAWKNTRTGDTLPAWRPERDPNEIVAPIAPQPQDIVIRKQKPSAFFGTNLPAYLTLLGADSIVMVGTTTSGCVRASAVDAFSLNYRVSVVEDACFDRSEASHAITLCDLHAKYADVVPSSDALDYVAGLPRDLFPNLPKPG